eukprot:scaffold5208_cov122-Amphora_coffeaeformis.AAC.1
MLEVGVRVGAADGTVATGDPLRAAVGALVGGGGGSTGERVGDAVDWSATDGESVGDVVGTWLGAMVGKAVVVSTRGVATLGVVGEDTGEETGTLFWRSTTDVTTLLPPSLLRHLTNR